MDSSIPVDASPYPSEQEMNKKLAGGICLFPNCKHHASPGKPGCHLPKHSFLNVFGLTRSVDTLKIAMDLPGIEEYFNQMRSTMNTGQLRPIANLGISRIQPLAIQKKCDVVPLKPEELIDIAIIQEYLAMVAATIVMSQKVEARLNRADDDLPVRVTPAKRSASTPAAEIAGEIVPAIKRSASLGVDLNDTFMVTCTPIVPDFVPSIPVALNASREALGDAQTPLGHRSNPIVIEDEHLDAVVRAQLALENDFALIKERLDAEERAECIQHGVDEINSDSEISEDGAPNAEDIAMIDDTPIPEETPAYVTYQWLARMFERVVQEAAPIVVKNSEEEVAKPNPSRRK